MQVLDSIVKALKLDRAVAEGISHALVDVQREDEVTVRFDTIELTLDQCLGTVVRASDRFTLLYVPPIDTPLLPPPNEPSVAYKVTGRAGERPPALVPGTTMLVGHDLLRG
jgi:hypothetical protein